MNNPKNKTEKTIDDLQNESVSGKEIKGGFGDPITEEPAPFSPDGPGEF